MSPAQSVGSVLGNRHRSNDRRCYAARRCLCHLDAVEGVGGRGPGVGAVQQAAGGKGAVGHLLRVVQRRQRDHPHRIIPRVRQQPPPARPTQTRLRSVPACRVAATVLRACKVKRGVSGERGREVVAQALWAARCTTSMGCMRRGFCGGRSEPAPAVGGDLHGQQREALPLAGHQALEARLAERRRGRAAVAAAAGCTTPASTSDGMSASGQQGCRRMHTCWHFACFAVSCRLPALIQPPCVPSPGLSWLSRRLRFRGEAPAPAGARGSAGASNAGGDAAAGSTGAGRLWPESGGNTWSPSLYQSESCPIATVRRWDDLGRAALPSGTPAQSMHSLPLAAVGWQRYDRCCGAGAELPGSRCCRSSGLHLQRRRRHGCWRPIRGAAAPPAAAAAGQACAGRRGTLASGGASEFCGAAASWGACAPPRGAPR